MPDKWAQVKEILALALEKSPEERSGFIRRACGEDRTLLAEVESLAAHHDGVDDLLESSPAAGLFSFQPGTMIGRKLGAYRIVRVIGQGGMAVVYLGERDDQHFRRSVAIKMVYPGPSGEEIFRRFRNERQTLAALDHPNIVKLLDGGSTEEGVPYLVMDYVDGAPINQYCDCHHLSVEDRLKLFRTVCSTVQYAHDKQVIHRDLKPANILITGEGIPRLLDFGIAKLSSPELFHTTLVTRTSWRPMTPEYASPEQIRGQSVTNATDVYSLGVLLYELLTGHRPYGGAGQSLLEIERAICETETEKPSTIASKPEESPQDGDTVTPELVAKNRGLQPSQLRRRLQGDLDTIVMKALRKEPENRYGSAAAFADDIGRHLTGNPVIARKPALSYRSARFLRRHKESVAAAVLALAVIAGVGAWQAHQVSRPGASPPALQAAHARIRSSVAILGFKNLSGRGDTEWISTALSEMLTTVLAAGEELRTIPGETVAQSKIDLSLPDAESIAPEKLEQVRRNLGADFVVLGSYADSGKHGGDQVRLDLRLEDTARKETVATVSEMGSDAELLGLVSHAGARLRERLGLSTISPLETNEITASFASSAEALRLYSQGLAKLRLFDALAARDLLSRAGEADPLSPLVHSALARVWQTLGYDAKAQEQAKQALDNADRLSREDHLLVEARYYEASRDWQKAIETYRALFNFFPDSVEYGLALARAQSAGGQGKAALNTLSALVRVSTYAADDPRIDLAMAEAASSMGDDKLRRDAAELAATKAGRLGAKLLLAQARNLECRALANLGENDQAKIVCEEATRIYAETGDRGGLARSLHNTAEVPLNQGDLNSAEKLYRRALAILQEIGDKRSTGSELVNLGLIAVKRGDFATGHRMYAASLRSYQEAGDKPGIAVVTGNTGNLLRAEGRLTEAVAHYQTTLKLSNELGHRGSAAIALQAIGDVLVEQGDLAGAYQMYQKALTVQQEIGARSNYAESLVGLGRVLRQQAHGNEALGDYQQALSLQQQLSEKGSAAETGLAIAELDCDSGGAAEAEQLARRALEEFHSQNEPAQEISAQGLLARSLLLEGRVKEARESIAQAKKLSDKTPDVIRQISLKLTDAYGLAATTDFLAAEHAAQQARRKAQNLGLVRLYLEASLALGEIQLKGKRPTRGRELLEHLTDTARSKGFELIARRAAAAI